MFIIKNIKTVLFVCSCLLFSGCEISSGSSADNNQIENETLTFSSPSSVHVDENQYYAITLQAHDSAGLDIHYSIALDDAASFDVNETSGEVRFKELPDYEKKTSYQFRAQATTGSANSEQNVTIFINNIAEIKPILKDTTLNVNENLPVGTVLGQVDVNSAGDTAISSFTLDDTENFEITNDGFIKNRVVLDYETQQQYILNVYATNGAGNSNSVQVIINVQDVYELVKQKIPTLVVLMNWNDYSENDPTVWDDKIFNKSYNSVNQWYDENTLGAIEFVPVKESSGTVNDGVITVSMGKNHPGGSDDTTFRDTEIRNAITNATVVDSMDFKALDLNNDGNLNAKELQIIFIVAGGEEAYGDAVDHSIWAHAWSFPSNAAPSVDGVSVMKYTGDNTTSGSYARFGANHDDHKATIGIISHELGHALFNLLDFYDDGGGSGLGWYDIMSAGSWGYSPNDKYAGDTPTQYSAYNRIDAGLDIALTEVNATQTLTLQCDSGELAKLQTSKPNEYFLLECRDTAKINSDVSLDTVDDRFTQNRIFGMLYHVDDDKEDNTEDGYQSRYNHYKVAVVEKDTTTKMTSTEDVRADFDDVYTLGDTIPSSKTELYDGSNTNYSIEVVDEDYTNRTMTFKITK
jgi:M6 family metalloprotease-like protein